MKVRRFPLVVGGTIGWAINGVRGKSEARSRAGASMINSAVYEKLVQVARERRTVTYVELAQAADLSLSVEDDMTTLGHQLDGIAEQEVAAGRPLLAVVVVKENSNMPGAGLFKFAKQKGLQKKGVDDITFFATELNRVHAFWSARTDS